MSPPSTSTPPSPTVSATIRSDVIGERQAPYGIVATPVTPPASRRVLDGLDDRDEGVGGRRGSRRAGSGRARPATAAANASRLTRTESTGADSRKPSRTGSAPLRRRFSSVRLTASAEPWRQNAWIAQEHRRRAHRCQRAADPGGEIEQPRGCPTDRDPVFATGAVPESGGPARPGGPARRAYGCRFRSCRRPAIPPRRCART